MRLAGDESAVLLVDHLGYSSDAEKTAILARPEQARVGRCHIVDAADRTRIRELTVEPAQVVEGWGPVRYQRIEFGDLRRPGTYWIAVEVDGGELVSEPFQIAAHRAQSMSVADITAYFRAARSSGEIDRKDRHARFYGDDSGREVDARGGWLDASGDYSKFLSHLTYTRMMSPQQIPLCAWAMMAAADDLRRAHPGFRTSQLSRLRDEGLFGADFLVRFQAPEGYFYTGIFDALTKRLEERVITAPLQDSVRTQRWQAAYRHGGGMAIAALARASTLDDHGEAGPGGYLDAAIRGFLHLEEHNTDYLFDGQESVIDDYCALLAAVEMVRALDARGSVARPVQTQPVQTQPVQTQPVVEQVQIQPVVEQVQTQPVVEQVQTQPVVEQVQTYRTVVVEAAHRRARRLTDRLRRDERGAAYLVGDHLGTPYFHAAESGLPVIALLRFAGVFAGDALADRATESALELLRGIAARADAVSNPFGYLRQRVRPEGGAPRDAFFYPHENETGYWWQGENANISSVAYAALLGAGTDVCDAELARRLRRLSADLLGWVTGRNPFDACMLQGRGRNNLEYSGVYQNSPGGILNGITSGFDDEDAIAFLPEDRSADGNEWRWAEQWIPHSAWFLLATCAAP